MPAVKHMAAVENETVVRQAIWHVNIRQELKLARGSGSVSRGMFERFPFSSRASGISADRKIGLTVCRVIHDMSSVISVNLFRTLSREGQRTNDAGCPKGPPSPSDRVEIDVNSVCA